MLSDILIGGAVGLGALAIIRLGIAYANWLDRNRP